MSAPPARAKAPLGRGERLLWAALFALVVALQGIAIARQSLTGDEQQHLLAGHQALAYGTNALNLEHPPLAKLVGALPADLEIPPLTPAELLPALPRLFDAPERARRARLAGRSAMLLLFGAPLLVAAFALGRRAGGSRAGLALAASLGLALSVLPHLSLVHTDTAVALGFACVALAALRFVERPGLRRAAALGLALALALATKFSGLLALPVAFAALALAPGGRIAIARRLGAAALVVAVAAVGVGAVYALANRGYDAVAGRRAIEQYCRGESPVVVGDRLARWERRLLALERVSPAAAQYLTGLLSVAAQERIGVYPSYFFGEVSSRGRVAYFPVVFAVKTPLALLLASGGAAAAALRRRRAAGDRAPGWPRPGAVPATLVAVYLGAALLSNYNIGLRHLLPVMPWLLLPAALWAARSGRRAALLAAALALEATLLAPRWVSATNLWLLGESNPTRFALSTSDSEMRQSFLLLADEAGRRGLRELAVLYPLLAPEELRAHLPDGRVVAPGERPAPGWYAVSVIVEQYVPALLAPSSRPLHDRGGLERLARDWEPTWSAVRRGEDHGYVAGTFHLYRLP